MIDKAPIDQLAEALDALMERAFRRNLFPAEVKKAFEALDAYEALKENPHA